MAFDNYPIDNAFFVNYERVLPELGGVRSVDIYFLKSPSQYSEKMCKGATATYAQAFQKVQCVPPK